MVKHYLSNNHINNWLTYSIVLACLAIIAVLSYRYLCDPWLWYDESGQFWIAKGLNHYSDPYSPEGGIIDVLLNNRDYNMDPGGFSVLLHYWSMISNHCFFLRLLPYLFFLAFAYCTALFVYRSEKNLLITAVCTTLLFLWSNTCRYMVELRAYSMEMFGIMLTIVLLPQIKRNILQRKSVLIFSLMLSFFCTSRYDFILFAFGVSIYILIIILNTNTTWKQKMRILVYYSVPLVIIVFFIVFMEMRYQNAGVNQLGYLDYLGSKPWLMKGSFFVIVCLDWVMIINQYYHQKHLSDIHNIFCICSIIFIGLSLANLYPWSTSRCIAILLLTYFTFIRFILKFFHTSNYIKALFCILFFKYNYWIPTSNIQGIGGYGDIVALSDQKEESVFIDQWTNPGFRYLYEYGNLKKHAASNNYPNNVYLQKGIKHNILYSNREDEKTKFFNERIQIMNNTSYDYYIFALNDIKSEFESNGYKFETVNGLQHTYQRIKSD